MKTTVTRTLTSETTVMTFRWKYQNSYNNSNPIFNRMHTSISVSEETKELVRSKKRGGITYDELIRTVFERYDPDRDDLKTEIE